MARQTDTGSKITWRRYEELRPEQLREIVQSRPIAFWPLGLLEHHGWHMPIGFDGIKADRFCVQLAQRVGGVILPVMWWGGSGGHGPFMWTHYQPEEASRAIVAQTVRQLIRFGFKVIVLPFGHYPWDTVLAPVWGEIEQEAKAHGVLLLTGDEGTIGRPAVKFRGDHAAKEETSFGLALLPEFVDQSLLVDGRDPKDHWPDGDDSPAKSIYPGVCADARKACFSQLGVDARQATAEHGWARLDPVLDELIRRIQAHLTGPA